MTELLLKVNGKSLGGWEEVRIQRSLNQMCGSFNLVVSDRSRKSLLDWGFKLGHSCVISYGSNTLLTGYIDDFNVTYNGTEHIVRIGGRDNTCDLVDCSFVPINFAMHYLNSFGTIEVPIASLMRLGAVSSSGGSSSGIEGLGLIPGYPIVSEWKNMKIVDIVRELCNPFGIDVYVNSDMSQAAIQDILTNESIGKFETFNTEGEKVAELITKICMSRAILPVSFGDGALTLTRAGTKRTITKLELGKNILKGNLQLSNKDRYSCYIIVGQGKGNDTVPLQSTIKPSFGWVDHTMYRSRFRPIIIPAETITNDGKCFERAAWEYARRAGNSRKVEYEVQGWLQGDNKTVWKLNTLVQVSDSILGIKDELLISEVEYILNETEGTITKLSLEDPVTYEKLEEPMELGTGLDMDMNKGEFNADMGYDL